MSAAAIQVQEPQVVGNIVLGADEFVARFVSARIPGVQGFDKFRALGVLRGGKLIGGVVYHNYRGHDCEVSSAMDDPRWARRGVLRALFDFPFNQLGCERLTAITAADNEATRRALKAQGFTQEGVHPRAWHDGVRGAISYGMLREDCRWIK